VLVSNFVAFEIGQRIFAERHLQVSLSHPGVIGAIFLGAAAVSLIAVIGVGLGGAIRHTAGATAAMAVIIVGGVTFGQLLPTAMRGYLPGTAIQAVLTVNRSPGILAPGTAILVLAIYAAITLTAASIRATHSDA
jgi:ABC-2 type transport system permease protein